MAELVDAWDLKSHGLFSPCRFKSGSRHEFSYWLLVSNLGFISINHKLSTIDLWPRNFKIMENFKCRILRVEGAPVCSPWVGLPDGCQDVC